MNKDLIQDIIDTIKATPEHFDMSSFIHADRSTSDLDAVNRLKIGQCGTTACIAGWAVTIAGIPIVSKDDTPFSFDEVAADLMGLDYQTQGRPLFFAMGKEDTEVPHSPDTLHRRVVERNARGTWTMPDITPQEAVRVLEILRDEGVVDWDRVITEINVGE